MSTYSVISYSKKETDTKIIIKELLCNITIQKNTYTLKTFTGEKWTFEKSNELATCKYKRDKKLLLVKNRRKRKLFLFSDLVTEKVKSENTFTCHKT